jgi:hypothetical protein
MFTGVGPATSSVPPASGAIAAHVSAGPAPRSSLDTSVRSPLAGSIRSSTSRRKSHAKISAAAPAAIDRSAPG